MYVYLSISTAELVFDDFDAAFGGFERLFDGFAVPLGLELFRFSKAITAKIRIKTSGFFALWRNAKNGYFCKNAEIIKTRKFFQLFCKKRRKRFDNCRY